MKTESHNGFVLTDRDLRGFEDERFEQVFRQLALVVLPGLNIKKERREK